MPTVLPPSLADFRGVLSETKRIVYAHTRHFLALTVLFLLPLSFSLSVFPTLLRCFSSSSADQNFPVHTLLRLPSSPLPPLHHRYNHFFHLGIPLKTLAFLLIFSSSALLFFIFAAASLTYSSFHGFYGRPVKLAAALSSLFRNFLPLLATFAAALIYILVAVFTFALYEFLSWKGISLIGGAAADSPYFFAISFVGAVFLAFVLLNFSINWILVSAVVVIEKRWGFDALTRSKVLVRAMRRTGMLLALFWGIQMASLIWLISASTINQMKNWTLAVHIVITSAILMMLLFQGISAGTVFYIYCKAVKGELDDEIANEYANFPFDDDDDDEKPPLLISGSISSPGKVQAGMEDTNSVSTPLAISTPLLKDGSLPSPTEHRCLVGSLQYLSLTRPNTSMMHPISNMNGLLYIVEKVRKT
ncbi:hypothetical protein V2J09_003682 [Rumex salicifolius]